MVITHALLELAHLPAKKVIDSDLAEFGRLNLFCQVLDTCSITRFSLSYKGDWPIPENSEVERDGLRQRGKPARYFVHFKPRIQCSQI